MHFYGRSHRGSMGGVTVIVWVSYTGIIPGFTELLWEEFEMVWVESVVVWKEFLW